MLVRSVFIAGLLFASVLMSGCAGNKDCDVKQSSTGQVAVCSHLNSFSYSNQAIGYSKTETYKWQNSFGTAHVSAAIQTNSGTVQLTIKDAAGRQVLSETYTSGQDSKDHETMEGGAAGTWSILVAVNGMTGQVAISATGRP